MSRIQKDIMRRLMDPDPAVCNASLVTACRLCQVHEPARVEIQNAVNELVRKTWTKNYDRRQRSILVHLLTTLRVLGLIDLTLLDEVIRRAARRKDYVLLRSAFLCFPPLQTQATLSVPGTVSPISHVRFLLTSREPNQQYLFLTCLECLDPKSWAGTTPDVPAVLEQWEVEHIMGFLDSPDSILRKKTAKILNNVDPNIVSTYYSNALQNLPNVLPVDAKSEHARRLLEVLEIQAETDGERYARDVLALLGQNDPDGHIFEDAIDMVLTYIRQSPDESRREISTHLLDSLLEVKRSTRADVDGDNGCSCL
ncbi:hypothetical protein BT96DRAFT_663006 [Gymnopus androsaceus JB14]|uniref:ARM repeat-containing protein n=1 Tax=Gymnopus androsaceus JB14 TaxID=1447944 RepID=A0A6A4IH24_9AGAR|nr:hypothetical protein BT96DRAFT_663006 [Gymnopus androsaceus JB14]